MLRICFCDLTRNLIKRWNSFLILFHNARMYIIRVRVLLFNVNFLLAWHLILVLGALLIIVICFYVVQGRYLNFVPISILIIVAKIIIVVAIGSVAIGIACYIVISCMLRNLCNRFQICKLHFNWVILIQFYFLIFIFLIFILLVFFNKFLWNSSTFSSWSLDIWFLGYSSKWSHFNLILTFVDLFLIFIRRIARLFGNNFLYFIRYITICCPLSLSFKIFFIVDFRYFKYKTFILIFKKLFDFIITFIFFIRFTLITRNTKVSYINILHKFFLIL